MEKVDRRVRKTKTALENTLIKLLKEKNLSKITAIEIANKADVHRATFYMHYQNVDDLFSSLENKVINDFQEIIKASENNNYEGIYDKIIDYIDNNRDLASVLLGKNANYEFQNKISEILENIYLDMWVKVEKRNKVSDAMRYLTHFHITGCISIISMWINEEYKLPTDKIKELVYKSASLVDNIVIW